MVDLIESTDHMFEVRSAVTSQCKIMGFVLPYVSQLWLNCYHTCAELEDDSERDYSCRCFFFKHGRG